MLAMNSDRMGGPSEATSLSQLGVLGASGRSARSELSRGRKANHPLGGKLGAIMPEINTLPPKPRAVGHWAWMIMMVLAMLAAIGRAVFG
jgi:hypothetical protein